MRDDFDLKTKETLAKRVGYRCSNPDCRQLTSGPQEDPTKVLNIGVTAHITAASEGGPRYNPSLTPEERRSVDNGIWLCQNCAKLVDNDVQRYTVVLLREWKQSAEEAARREVQGLAPPLPCPSPDAIARHRAALRDRLEAEARVRWGGMSLYIQEEGATLPIHASPYQTGRLGPGQNLLALLCAARRLLVLGEPGSGKTVSLERLAWELCDGPEPVVPVLVPLFHYEGAPLAEWVRATLRETGHLRLDDEQALLAFLGQEALARCFFLFDGLNEVPPAYRDRLAGEFARWISAHPLHPVVLTSRPQDELWRRLRADVDQALVVQPIADQDARAYLVAHLGERGDELYARLDERLRAMARTPLILWLIKEAGAAGESVPGNRGELHARFVSRMLRRDTDRRMDADIHERVKRRALTDLAYHLGLAQRLSCPRDEAVEVVARQVGEDQAEQVVAACARHGLLAGEDTVWFAPHQTVQEHFAALALQELAEQEWGMARWKRLLRMLTAREEGLAALAADDWWMETFVQLAGLVDDADRLALEVARVNPWLAWWCVEEGRGVQEGTREAVADRSVRLLESKRAADRRRAVAALARMRSERVVQPLFRAAADPDPEATGLAVQALLDMGETVRAQAIVLARQPRHPLHQAGLAYGLAYLKRLLDLDMIWIPPGPFLMGSDKGRDPQAFDNELPQHEVTLPGYWIGRYPVTVAQFRAFVEASGHRPADPDSLKGPDDHPVVRVTWYDALAFCSWLSEKAGIRVTLPSEAQWEKAARGTDGRVYPWGNRWDASRCNSWEAGPHQTTPVGAYPQGTSPYGLLDMAGNVWEWCSSIYKPYPYDPGDGRENPEGESYRALRGGSWHDGQYDARCAFRRGNHPGFWNDVVGFRCARGSE